MAHKVHSHSASDRIKHAAKVGAVGYLGASAALDLHQNYKSVKELAPKFVNAYKSVRQNGLKGTMKNVGSSMKNGFGRVKNFGGAAKAVGEV